MNETVSYWERKKRDKAMRKYEESQVHNQFISVFKVRFIYRVTNCLIMFINVEGCGREEVEEGKRKKEIRGRHGFHKANCRRSKSQSRSKAKK